MTPRERQLEEALKECVGAYREFVQYIRDAKCIDGVRQEMAAQSAERLLSGSSEDTERRKASMKIRSVRKLEFSGIPFEGGGEDTPKELQAWMAKWCGWRHRPECGEMIAHPYCVKMGGHPERRECEKGRPDCPALAEMPKTDWQSRWERLQKRIPHWKFQKRTTVRIDRVEREMRQIEQGDV